MTTEIEQVLRRLQENNVRLIHGGPAGGRMTISVDDALEILERGEAAFLARRCGVSLERYQQWAAFVREPSYCRGVNRTGEPCRRPVDRMLSLRDFEPADMYCRYHKDQAKR